MKGDQGELKEDNFTHEFSALVTLTHTSALVVGLLFAKNSPSSQNLKDFWRHYTEIYARPNFIFALLVFGVLVQLEGAWEVINWMCEVRAGGEAGAKRQHCVACL